MFYLDVCDVQFLCFSYYNKTGSYVNVVFMLDMPFYELPPALETYSYEIYMAINLS